MARRGWGNTMSIRDLINMGSLAAEAAAIRRTQAVIEFEPSGKIVWANELFLQTVGYAFTEIEGQHHSMFVEPGERAGADYQHFWTRLAAGEAMKAQFLRIGKGGKRIWLQAIYTPVMDQSGKVKKVVKFATDITAHKTDIANINQQSSQVEQGSDQVQTSAQGLSELAKQLHELIKRFKI